jgi:hypothetical protein
MKQERFIYFHLPLFICLLLGLCHLPPCFSPCKKVKLSLCYKLWKPLGEWRYGSNIIYVCNIWSWVASFTYRSLHLRGKIPRDPLDRISVGGQACVDAVEQRKICRPCPESNTDRPPIACFNSDLAIPAPLSHCISKLTYMEHQLHHPCKPSCCGALNIRI